jgi:hypothetical protein
MKPLVGAPIAELLRSATGAGFIEGPMTEVEWRACELPWEALPAVADRMTARKLRLFACACCRRVAHLARDPRYEAAVEVLERFADGLVRDSARIRAAKLDLDDSGLKPNVVACLLSELRRAAAKTVTRDARDLGQSAAAAVSYTDARRFQALKRGEAGRQLLRDIAGNPFRLVAFSPARRTDTALALARQMYGSRDFSAMPILADALQDAGCDTEEVLSHCRDPEQVHVRGCWVVDLVLGRE